MQQLTHFIKLAHLLSKIIILLVALFGLISCAQNLRPVPNNLNPQQQYAYLNRLTQWSLEGRVAFVNQAEGGTASIFWSQQQESFNIELYGPLNIDGLSLKGSPAHVQLITSNGNRYVANSPEALLQQQTGWTFPLSGLTYWLRGLPSPHSHAHNIRKNAQQQLQQLEQDGWHIQFLEYAYYPPVALPYKIQLSREHIKLKFILTQWKLNNFSPPI